MKTPFAVTLAGVWFHRIHGLVYSASVPSAPCPMSPFARTDGGILLFINVFNSVRFVSRPRRADHQ